MTSSDRRGSVWSRASLVGQQGEGEDGDGDGVSRIRMDGLRPRDLFAGWAPNGQTSQRGDRRWNIVTLGPYGSGRTRSGRGQRVKKSKSHGRDTGAKVSRHVLILGKVVVSSKKAKVE